MAWAPKYGLKGMIDASVRVEVGSNKYKTSEKVVPLEFKSGKPPNGQASRMLISDFCANQHSKLLKFVDSEIIFDIWS